MPDVMSLSWGGAGAYAVEEPGYAALAAQGVTVVASSGDAGALAGSSISNTCQVSGVGLGGKRIMMRMPCVELLVKQGDHMHEHTSHIARHPRHRPVAYHQGPVMVEYPAASPWVTAVGAVGVARPKPGAAPKIVGASAALGSAITRCVAVMRSRSMSWGEHMLLLFGVPFL